MRAVCVVVLVVVSGCHRQPEFADWREELAYLKSQANTTPAQFKRLQELARKAEDEKRAVAAAEEARRQKIEDEVADEWFHEAQATEEKDPSRALTDYDFFVKSYPLSPKAEQAKARIAVLMRKIAEGKK